MPLTNFPQGVSSYGMPLLAPPPLMTAGNVFWVSSLAGTDATGRGTGPANPFKTLQFALTKVNSPSTNPSKPGNDIIILMPGHVENVNSAAYITTTASTVNIIGIGNGTLRPLIQWSATAATMVLAANGTRFYNCVFDFATQITGVVAPISVTGSGISFQAWAFTQSTGSNVATVGISLNTGWASFSMIDCTVDSPVAGATQFLSVVAAGDGITLLRVRIRGQFSNADINTGAVNVTGIKVSFCQLDNFASNKPVLKTGNAGTATQGYFDECLFTGVSWANAAGSVSLGTNGNIFFRQCFGAITVGGNGIFTPAQNGAI